MVNKNIRVLAFYYGTNVIKARALDDKEQPMAFTMDDIFGIKDEPDILCFKHTYFTIYVREDQLIYVVKKCKTRGNILLLDTGLSIPEEEFFKQLREQRGKDNELENGILLKMELGKI